MNTIECTEEMEVSRWYVPAWVKLALYVALGALTWKGLIITYEEAKKALIQAKYSYVSSVVGNELDGKSFSLTTDMRDNKKHQFGDLSPAQMSMALWAMTIQLEQCNGLLSDINSMSNNITVVK